jgi:hypothetical protein
MGWGMSDLFGWRFPSNDDGEDDDLNNPGIESFNDTPLNSLAREICQNSLDAVNHVRNKPVEIHFTNFEIEKKEFPDICTFIQILEACKAYRPNSKKFQAFFDKALLITNQEKIQCLMISDHNTTGLMGVGESKHTDWHKLTKAVGGSDKSDGLGSFGIGKFAPYANSDLRTVFYSTKNLNNEFGFQGVSRLVTHEMNEVTTRGTGYYGIQDRNRPIVEKTSIPNFILREDYGTNILITGFREIADWESEIISAVVINFFYALMNEKLIVKAGDKEINSSTLPGIINKLKEEKRDNYTSAYYSTLTSSDTREFVDENFEGMGKISLKILMNKDYPKKVAMVRGSGMKIFDKGNFLTPLRFAGVFNVIGGPINKYLKSLENPQHNNFLKARDEEDPKNAERILGKLYSWINSRVKSIAEEQIAEEADIEGVSKFLPDDLEDDVKRADSKDVEDRSEAADEIPIIIKSRDRFSQPTYVPSEPIQSNEEDHDFEFEKHGQVETKNKGGSGTPEVAPGGPGGGPGGGRSSGPGKSTPFSVPIELSYQRLFSTDVSGGSYLVSFIPKESISGVFELFGVGEIGQEAVEISEAKLVTLNQYLPINKEGGVGPFEMKAGEKYTLEVHLKTPIRCALGVSVNAN